MRRSTKVLQADHERNHKTLRPGVAHPAFKLHTPLEAGPRASSRRVSSRRVTYRASSQLLWLRKAAVATAVGAMCFITAACAPIQPANQSQADIANAIGMSAGSSNIGATGEWMRINQRHHVVDLIVVSGVNGRVAFNGYPNGKMTVSIPQQWRVRLMFENRSHVTLYRPVIVPYNQRQDEAGLHAVYAQNPGMMRGTTIPPGQSDTQTFRTTTAGRYVLIAAEAGGKRRAWGNFVISKHEALPRIYTPIVG